MNHRYLFSAIAALDVVAIAIAAVLDETGAIRSEPGEDAVAVAMYKSPQCSCCDTWAEHAQQNGFAVATKYRGDMARVKSDLGVPDDLLSCHTSVIDGYVVEGHVPADAIQKLLKERPRIVGIGVAGMPAGSPGMASGTPQSYNVIAFDASGRQYVFARY